MNYNHKLKKPVFDREFKVFVFRNEPYNDLVRKCAYYTFPDTAKESDIEFYLADSSCHRIGGEDLALIYTMQQVAEMKNLWLRAKLKVLLFYSVHKA